MTGNLTSFQRDTEHQEENREILYHSFNLLLTCFNPVQIECNIGDAADYVHKHSQIRLGFYNHMYEWFIFAVQGIEPPSYEILNGVIWVCFWHYSQSDFWQLPLSLLSCVYFLVMSVWVCVCVFVIVDPRDSWNLSVAQRASSQRSPLFLCDGCFSLSQCFSSLNLSFLSWGSSCSLPTLPPSLSLPPTKTETQSNTKTPSPFCVCTYLWLVTFCVLQTISSKRFTFHHHSGYRATMSLVKRKPLVWCSSLP